MARHRCRWGQLTLFVGRCAVRGRQRRSTSWWQVRRRRRRRCCCWWRCIEWVADGSRETERDSGLLYTVWQRWVRVISAVRLFWLDVLGAVFSPLWRSPLQVPIYGRSPLFFLSLLNGSVYSSTATLSLAPRPCYRQIYSSIYAVITTTIRLRFDGRSTSVRLLIEGH